MKRLTVQNYLRFAAAVKIQDTLRNLNVFLHAGSHVQLVRFHKKAANVERNSFSYFSTRKCDKVNKYTEYLDASFVTN
jgi:hypothetical protein